MARNKREYDKHSQALLDKLRDAFNEQHESGEMQEMIDEDTRTVFETGKYASLCETFAAVQGMTPSQLTFAVTTRLSPEAFGHMFCWLLSYTIYSAWQRGKDIALTDSMHYGMTLHCIDEMIAINRRKNRRNEA